MKKLKTTKVVGKDGMSAVVVGWHKATHVEMVSIVDVLMSIFGYERVEEKKCKKTKRAKTRTR